MPNRGSPRTRVRVDHKTPIIMAPRADTGGGVGWREDALHVVIMATDIQAVAPFPRGRPIPEVIGGRPDQLESGFSRDCHIRYLRSGMEDLDYHWIKEPTGYDDEPFPTYFEWNEVDGFNENPLPFVYSMSFETGLGSWTAYNGASLARVPTPVAGSGSNPVGGSYSLKINGWAGGTTEVVMAASHPVGQGFPITAGDRYIVRLSATSGLSADARNFIVQLEWMTADGSVLWVDDTTFYTYANQPLGFWNPQSTGRAARATATKARIRITTWASAYDEGLYLDNVTIERQSVGWTYERSGYAGDWWVAPSNAATVPETLEALWENDIYVVGVYDGYAGQGLSHQWTYNELTSFTDTDYPGYEAPSRYNVTDFGGTWDPQPFLTAVAFLTGATEVGSGVSTFLAGNQDFGGSDPDDIVVGSTGGFPPSGTLQIGGDQFTYSSIATVFHFRGISGPFRQFSNGTPVTLVGGDSTIRSLTYDRDSNTLDVDVTAGIHALMDRVRPGGKKLDVALLLDDTGSFGSSEDVKRSFFNIVLALGGEEWDLQVAVAMLSEYCYMQFPNGYGGADERPYQLLRPLEPVDVGREILLPEYMSGFSSGSVFNPPAIGPGTGRGEQGTNGYELLTLDLQSSLRSFLNISGNVLQFAAAYNPSAPEGEEQKFIMIPPPGKGQTRLGGLHNIIAATAGDEINLQYEYRRFNASSYVWQEARINFYGLPTSGSLPRWISRLDTGLTVADGFWRVVDFDFTVPAGAVGYDVTFVVHYEPVIPINTYLQYDDIRLEPADGLWATLTSSTTGGGGDGPETCWEGLWQLATGAGMDGNGDGDTDDSGEVGVEGPGSFGDLEQIEPGAWEIYRKRLRAPSLSQGYGYAMPGSSGDIPSYSPGRGVGGRGRRRAENVVRQSRVGLRARW